MRERDESRSVPALLCSSNLRCLRLDANCLRMGSLRHFEVQNTVFQCCGYLGGVDFRGQIDNPHDFLGAPLGIDSLSLFVFFLGFVLACHRQPAGLEIDGKFLGGEARHLGANCQVIVRFRYFEVQGVQEFGFGADPIFQVVAEPPAVIVKDLKCSSGDRAVGFLDPIEYIIGVGLLNLCRTLIYFSLSLYVSYSGEDSKPTHFTCPVCCRAAS